MSLESDTAGKACKVKGTTLLEVSKTVRVSPQTLDNWFKSKPYLFKAVVSYTANLSNKSITD